MWLKELQRMGGIVCAGGPLGFDERTARTTQGNPPPAVRRGCPRPSACGRRAMDRCSTQPFQARAAERIRAAGLEDARHKGHSLIWGSLQAHQPQPSPNPPRQLADVATAPAKQASDYQLPTWPFPDTQAAAGEHLHGRRTLGPAIHPRYIEVARERPKHTSSLY